MSAAPDDVREFAEALTRLKERTDRSYGQLARRLGMNTSTLHRYCAGDTVPLDFAPVERFAALCGATGAERLELHRLWLPAVAARQRARTGGGGVEPGEQHSEPGESPESGEPVRSGEPIRSGEPVKSVGTAEPSESSAETAEPAPGAADAGEPVAPSAGTADPAEPVRSAEASEPVVVSASASVASVRRPWHRRRRSLVGAAVGAVLIATLGSLAALPGGGSRSADGSAGGGEPTPSRTTSAAQRPSTAPTSPSPTPPSDTDGTKRPSGTPSTSPTEPDSGATKDGETAERKPPATGVPLTWTANSQLWASGCAHDYVVAKPPKEVPPPPAPQDGEVWAATQRGVHGRNTTVEITVQGRKSTAVVLTALRVRVVGRTTPVEGNAYGMGGGCGGRVTPRYFDVNLDKDRPIARPVDGADLDVRIPAVSFPYRVSAEDPEVLKVSAETETCDCSWYLELDWSSEGRTGTVRIDDGGSPFRTTAVKGLPRYEYDTVNRGWVPVTG